MRFFSSALSTVVVTALLAGCGGRTTTGSKFRVCRTPLRAIGFTALEPPVSQAFRSRRRPKNH